MFGSISSDIKNIGVTNLDIQGDNGVGGLVGFSDGANITKSYSSVDILPALKREDSHGTVPLGWDIRYFPNESRGCCLNATK